jgi:hypothetical protein
MTLLRKGLPDVPLRMRALPLDKRGYPVPYFVTYINGEPDFRIADQQKLALCVKLRKCWVCGNPLGTWETFVVGPMCSISRTTAEPPTHYECALFSVKACPFLILPKSRRNDANLPDGHVAPPGAFLTHNPGITAILSSTERFKLLQTPAGQRDYLFRMPIPERIEWWCSGRVATPAEITNAMRASLRTLRAISLEHDGPDAQAELEQFIEQAGAVNPYVLVARDSL